MTGVSRQNFLGLLLVGTFLLVTSSAALAQARSAPGGHVKLKVHNGTGSGELYKSGEVVPVGATPPGDGFTFVQWFHTAGDGSLAAQDKSSSKFTMGTKDAEIVATFAKLESWFPPGPEDNKKSLLLPKPSEGQAPRLEQRIRITVSRGSASKPPFPDILNLIDVKIKWEDASNVKFFDKETEGQELTSDAALQRDLFDETSQGVYEASIWFEGNLSAEAMAQQAQKASSLQVKITLKLVVAGQDKPPPWEGTLEPIAIKKVYSDQFPDRENVNYFTHENTSTGERQYILMAEREDGKAYLKVKLNPEANIPGIKDAILVALADPSVEPLSLVGECETMDGNNTMSLMLEDATTDRYIAVAGYDADGDGALQHNEVVSETKFFCRVTTKENYNTRKMALGPLSLVPGSAGRFLSAFLKDTPVTGASSSPQKKLEVNAPSLAHNVGLLFGSDATADILENIFDDGTAVEDEIANSYGLKRLLKLTLLPQLVLPVSDHFDANPEDKDEVFHTSFDGIIAYQFLEDPRLFAAFLRANLKIQVAVTVRGSDRQVVQIVLSGTHEDLYDFDYEVNPGPASVQSGYKTLGEAGRIFRSIVNLKETFFDISYQF